MATRTNQAAVEAFVRKQGVTYLQLADYDSKVMVQLEGVPSTTVPSTIFIDRKGRVAGWALGAVDEALLRSIVKSLLEE
jgi:peroxiredoxin